MTPLFRARNPKKDLKATILYLQVTGGSMQDVITQEMFQRSNKF